MKILILIPGSWSHGLDSPERGESRWAQNLARLLGKSGKYKVYASGSGDPYSGSGRPAPGVTLLKQEDADRHGPYDFYFGSTVHSKPIAESRFYFHVHWSLEDAHRDESFPKNHFIVYPHYDMKDYFFSRKNPNSDRVLFMPTPFGECLDAPAFDKQGILWPTKDPILVSPPEVTRKTISVIRSTELKIYWWFAEDLERYDLINRSECSDDEFIELSPYWKMLEIIDKCKLNAIVGNPSCIPDCAVKGVPSLIWESNHVMPFVHEVAKRHDLLLPLNSDLEDVREVTSRLLNDKDTYRRFVSDLQYTFRHHTEPEVLKCFEKLVDKIC